MNRKTLEDELKLVLRETPAPTDKAHLERTLLLARKETLQKQNRKRISFGWFLQKQLSYIGWKIWGMQCLFLLVTVGFFPGFSGDPINPLHLAKLLFCLSVAVLMMALPLLYRCVRYRMQEIEAASRFSSVKLLLAKLIVIGIGDLVLLCGIFLAAAIKTSLPTDSVVFYLCFPFLLACGGCLFLLGHLPPHLFFMGSLALCTALMLGCSILPERYAFFLQSASPAGRAAVCALLFVFCAMQLRYIIYTSSYTETQLV